MALKEKIEEVILDLGWEPGKVKVDRNADIHGVPSWNAELTFKREGRTFRVDHSWAKGNNMSEDEMAWNLRSYLIGEDFDSL